MEALIERVAGLDVHQGSVVACIIIGAAGRRPAKEVRSFGAMRQDLAAMRAWLLERGVTHVGMEATGVYWRPVHAALEGAFTLIVGNASHMRNVPGRKTDEGRRVDRRPDPAWAGAPQLCAAARGQGAA
jgi:transposase